MHFTDEYSCSCADMIYLSQVRYWLIGLENRWRVRVFERASLSDLLIRGLSLEGRGACTYSTSVRCVIVFQCMLLLKLIPLIL